MTESYSGLDYVALSLWSALCAFMVWITPAMWQRRTDAVKANLEWELWGKALNRAGARPLPLVAVTMAGTTVGAWLLATRATRGVGVVLIFLVAAVGGVLALVSTLLNRPKWVVPPYSRDEPGVLAMWFRAAKVKERHRVDVHDVRPENPGDYEPYFVAICDCGWVGDIRDGYEEAVRDAMKHHPDGNPKTVRPVA